MTRWRRRSSSSTGVSSSTGNGGVSDSASVSASATSSSISPVSSFGLTLPSSRRTTVPVADTTCSGRSRSASAWASAAVSGWKTSWTIPERSRRSMKISPPWSRRRCTQPATRTVESTSPARSSPHQASRKGSARGGLTGASAADVMHHRVGLHRLLLPGLHVLEGGPLLTQDRNEAGPGAVRLLELALQRAAAELQARGVAGAAGVGGEPERGRRGTRAGVGDVEVERRLARPAAAARRAGSARRPRPSPCPASAAPPMISIRPS